jgi:hypothetical protein
MLPSSAIIGDGPETRILDREFEDEGIIGMFARCARRAIGRWEDLHSRPSTTPPALYAKSAEAELSTHLSWPFEKGPFDFCANSLPFRAVESRAGFDNSDPCAFIDERNPTSLAGEGQVEHIEVTIILTRATDPLLKKQPQVCLVEIGPGAAKKILRHCITPRTLAGSLP